MSSHYSTLNLTTSATEAEIMSAYRKLSLKCHPDKGGNAKDFHRLTEAKDYCLKQLERPVEQRGRRTAPAPAPARSPATWPYPCSRRYQRTPEEMANLFASTHGSQGDSVPFHKDPRQHSIGFRWAKLVVQAWLRKRRAKRAARGGACHAEQMRAAAERLRAEEAVIQKYAEIITALQEEARACGRKC